KPLCRHSRESGNLEPNATKIYPKRQQSFHRHSRAGGNPERKISRNRFTRQVSVPTDLDSRLRGNDGF
ncbi:TPA: hypothetical protein ACTCUY_000881, partial [Neisseria meningitidis]